jgi:hypothetical protein
MTKEHRWRCTECDTVVADSELLKAKNPFAPNDIEELYGCPKCLSVMGTTDLLKLCDEPGCNLLATCGFPVDDGYRRTCSLHANHCAGWPR